MKILAERLNKMVALLETESEDLPTLNPPANKLHLTRRGTKFSKLLKTGYVKKKPARGYRPHPGTRLNDTERASNEVKLHAAHVAAAHKHHHNANNHAGYIAQITRAMPDGAETAEAMHHHETERARWARKAKIQNVKAKQYPKEHKSHVDHAHGAEVAANHAAAHALVLSRLARHGATTAAEMQHHADEHAKHADAAQHHAISAERETTDSRVTRGVDAKTKKPYEDDDIKDAAVDSGAMRKLRAKQGVEPETRMAHADHVRLANEAAAKAAAHQKKVKELDNAPPIKNSEELLHHVTQHSKELWRKHRHIRKAGQLYSSLKKRFGANAQ